MELDTLLSLLGKSDNLMIALGGGALNDLSLRNIRGLSGRLVWLNTSFESCYQRVMKHPKLRPMSKMPLTDLKELFENRSKWYCQSDLILDEDEQSQCQDLSALLKKL